MICHQWGDCNFTHEQQRRATFRAAQDTGRLSRHTVGRSVFFRRGCAEQRFNRLECCPLVAGEMPAGYHTVTWNASDDAGARVASDMYVYTLKADPSTGSGQAFTMQRKLVRMK